MNNERSSLVNFITQVFPMPPMQAEEIAGHFTPRHFDKNDFLQQKGRYTNDYFFMETGYARAFTFDLEGNDVTTAFYGPNQVVCELYSFFKRIPSQENIQVLADCETWSIDYETLQKVFHSLFMFREFGRTVLINAYASLKARMLSLVQNTAEERYSQLLHSNPDVFQYAALKQIASYLGITDSSLSRIRKEFAKK